ncbi:transglutaminase TgpA family protein [Metabacillus hrfriensis]|uniref:TransglutaminaseTgpA domain-containing protein n=1 Tax=Metabacillus hrfriensis TaxID=3048891 RepID=A0ACD4RCG4_9BACI|nr:transglutaminaseTgpA domain-containing protein [Metabacillus sp. CT-WN-B3]WHZ58126.1 transglutaminaseTgpA domain-containing protein [Metabacillus sp. CT-WN-B3]
MSENFDKLTSAYIYYGFAFLLLWEWLRPLQDFTETGNTVVFVLFIGLSFLFISVKARWYIGALVKIFYILFVQHLLFFEGSFFSPAWIGLFIGDISNNAALMMEANWMEISSPFRTLLFFVLLWLLVYLINYWIIFQKRIMFFFIITIVYVTVLDTFTEYDASFAIVRIVVIGFVLIGLLYLERIKILERIKRERYMTIKWVLPLSALIGCAVLVGILSPKAEPQWPDPVPYLTAYGGSEGGPNGTVNKIGYGPNDEQLGGAFVADDTPVFTAVAEDRHYWRVETKDLYTGKGWDVSDSEAESVQMDPENITISSTVEGVDTVPLTASVEIDDQYRYDHVIYPAGIKSVTLPRDSALDVNPLTELMTPRLAENRGNFSPGSYVAAYEFPDFKIDELRKVSSNNGVPEDIRARFTQLPEELPQRVRDLALELTSGNDNYYDKAKSIETYLGGSQFTYETTDVAVPRGEEDYVDQFLFETFKGYCDNFSTSMIVLLRAADIPARWVKGYSDGAFIQNLGGNQKEYKITNNNAHSWVEVYFSGIGWVPFEPTKSFTNPYDFTFNLDSQERAETETPEQSQPEKEPVTEENNTPQSSSSNSSSWPFSIQIGSTAFYLILIAAVMIAFTLYKTRLRWMPYLILYTYKHRKDEKVYGDAYVALLKQLERYGLKRHEGQTLRDYARYVDSFFDVRDMTKLTASYEKSLYRGDNSKEEWIKSKELWENLIKKISS